MHCFITANAASSLQTPASAVSNAPTSTKGHIALNRFEELPAGGINIQHIGIAFAMSDQNV